MKRVYLLLFSMIALFLSSVLMTSCNMKGEHRTISYSEHTDKKDNDNFIEKCWHDIENIFKDEDKKNNHREKTNDDVETNNSIENVADSLKLTEHIVYYLDYSGSMEREPHPCLFKDVKDSLIESIRNIKGENIEIEVIPFLDARLWDNGNPRRVFKITKGKNFREKELKNLCDSIRKIKALNKDSNKEWYETHHNIVINDFLKNRINNAKQYHLMVLLTDGEDRSKSPSGADVLNESWSEKTKGKYVFGVYCDLKDEGQEKSGLAERFNGNNRLFYKTDLNLDFDVSILGTGSGHLKKRVDYA